MPKLTKTKPATKPVTKKPVAKPATKTTRAAEPPAPSDRTLQAIFDRWAAPDDAAEAAYLSQYTDEQCIADGERTKAALVSRDAATWAVIMDGDLRSKNAADIDYTASRFGYYLRCLQTLRREVVANTTQLGGTLLSKADALQAEKTAKKQDLLLVKRLRLAAGKRVVEKGEIATRRAAANANVSPNSPEGVAARLAETCALADEWLARTDPGFAFLLKEHGVTKERVAKARAAEVALSSARTGARGRSASPKDTPTENLAEGRMLAEMLAAEGAWDVANLENPAIKKLVPGKGTRAVLGGHRKTAAAADSTDGAPPAAGAPPLAAAGKVARKKPRRRGR